MRFRDIRPKQVKEGGILPYLLSIGGHAALGAGAVYQNYKNKQDQSEKAAQTSAQQAVQTKSGVSIPLPPGVTPSTAGAGRGSADDPRRLDKPAIKPASTTKSSHPVSKPAVTVNTPKVEPKSADELVDKKDNNVSADDSTTKNSDAAPELDWSDEDKAKIRQDTLDRILKLAGQSDDSQIVPDNSQDTKKSSVEPLSSLPATELLPQKDIGGVDLVGTDDDVQREELSRIKELIKRK